MAKEPVREEVVEQGTVEEVKDYDGLKAQYEELLKHNENLSKDYNKLVKAFNKLLKEYNDLHIAMLLKEASE